jgi:hypothetical protein
MKFDPSATNGIGHDHSGNGNNFTASGFTTSGTGTDVMDDTPTTNYATWNPVEESDTWNAYGVGMSNGNLQYGTNNYWNTFTSTIAFSSGKWYYELEVTGNNQGGIVASDWTGTPGVALADGGALGYNRNDGKIYEDNNSGTSYGNTFTGTHTLGIAVDADTDKFYFAIDNTWQNSANPSSGTGGYSITMGSKPWRFAASAYSCTGQIANFGQRAFIYTPPTGFKALNTANLPAPDIADGSKNFGIKLYQGNEGDVSAPATQTITDLKFAPDFVWIKCRNSGTANHSLFDQVRGTGKTLWSNSVSNEQTNYTRGYLSAFTSDGFTVRAGNTDARDVNGLGTTGSPPTQYVAWNWKAGGSGSSNTAGTITSTVSANPSAGFSIVSYTGNSTDNATVGHGLGVKPDFVIIKNRDNGNTYPFAWHKSFGNEEIIWLSEADTKQTPGTRYIRFGNNTATVFSLGTNNEANAGDDYIAYCFAEVEGYSKFGSYTGNANANGPFVYCGFRPAWVLIKVTNIGTTNWIVFDSVRQTYNVIGPWLMPSATNAEIVSDYIDFLSNGFKLRVSNNLVNGSGTYIFAAFAEHPFGGDGVSPATAR